MNPIIQELIECLRTHVRESRVVGIVQAGPAADALEALEARTEYLTSCPACDAAPTEDTGFPLMDEDGCCITCGMDCSIAGLVDSFKQNEEAVRVFRHALVQIKNHTEDPASEITASIALSEQP